MKELELTDTYSSTLHIQPETDGPLITYFAGSHANTLPACPNNIHWNKAGLERDLYIQTTTVTILAMDGRRRWLDIKKLVSLSS